MKKCINRALETHRKYERSCEMIMTTESQHRAYVRLRWLFPDMGRVPFQKFPRTKPAVGMTRVDSGTMAAIVKLPRMVTTADSPMRNRSGVGFLHRTRTGYQRGQMDPVQVRCASGRPGAKVPKTSVSGLRQSRCYPLLREKRTSGFRKHVNICPHPWRDVLEGAFTKITNCPPRACVNQYENLLAHMRVGTFRNSEIRDPRIKWCIDPAVVEVVLRVLYSRCSGPTLVS